MKLDVVRKPLPPIEKIVIEFTPEEATALRAICGKIGGSPKGPRQMFNDIYYQLHEAGIDRGDHRLTGSIYIEPNDRRSK